MRKQIEQKREMSLTPLVLGPIAMVNRKKRPKKKSLALPDADQGRKQRPVL